MSEIAQHQNIFRVEKHDTSSAQSRAKKRNRQTVSCSACKTRKLKCDRQMPCMSCSKRGDTMSCDYSNDVHTSRNGPERSTKESEAQVRLQRLEAMVAKLMPATSGSSHEFGANSSSPDLSAEPTPIDSAIAHSPNPSTIIPKGHLEVHGPEAKYVGATHWATVLENIREIQGLLVSDDAPEGEGSSNCLSNDPDIIMDTTRQLTLSDVYNSLPPRAVVDRLLFAYFNAKQIQFHTLIHTGKFLREYESFWLNPTSTSFLWISMLFSTLHVGYQVSQSREQDPFVGSLSESMRTGFLIRAGESLVAGNYRQAKPYSVEALLMYAACKHTRTEDVNSDVWMTVGMSARLAMKMGYHRDPRHLANITPFEGEMRRRTFLLVENFELLLSYQAGLPAIVHEEECDVEPPRNLLDSDFDEDCTTLPPSRPVTDPTPMLYLCTKGRLSRIFRRVLRRALSFGAYSYDDTLNLDRQLRQLHADTPPSLRMKPLASSFTDPACMIYNRRNLETLYLKVICVLHRNYLTHERSNPASNYSRKVCAGAALELLGLQAELHTACQPGGQLYEYEWMMSSITLQDFLLASMIISLDLHESAKEPVTVLAEEEKLLQANKYDALRQAYGIWKARSSTSRDARRAAAILEAILSRIPRPDLSYSYPQEHSVLPDNSYSTDDIRYLGSVVPGSDVPSQFVGSDDPGLPQHDITGSLDAVFNASDSFDWGLVDQCLLGRTGDDAFQFDWQSFNEQGAAFS